MRVLVVAACVAGLWAALGAVFAAGWWASPDGPRGIGQGWTDVCASVGPDVAGPLSWRFVGGGRVVASGVCP